MLGSLLCSLMLTAPGTIKGDRPDEPPERPGNQPPDRPGIGLLPDSSC